MPKYYITSEGTHFSGLINQLLNIATLTVLPPIGYLYLKASAIADVLSIFFAIPFVIRHGNLHNPYSRKEMLYHAHLELPLFNALATARYAWFHKLEIEENDILCDLCEWFKLTSCNIHPLAINIHPPDIFITDLLIINGEVNQKRRAQTKID